MKSFTLIVIFCISFAIVSTVVLSQEPNASFRDSSTCNIKGHEIRLWRHHMEISVTHSILSHPYKLSSIIHQSLTTSLYRISVGMQKNLEISSIWKNESIRQNEHKTLKTILAGIEMGAAVYLAYEHIRRYGSK